MQCRVGADVHVASVQRLRAVGVCRSRTGMQSLSCSTYGNSQARSLVPKRTYRDSGRMKQGVLVIARGRTDPSEGHRARDEGR